MIRVIIAEDQTLLRGALGVLLGLEEDIEIAGQAADGKEALALISKLQPDVCLLDIEMPEKTGLEVAEQLRDANSACKVIILTTFARPGYFERSVNAGVSGYLLKDGPSEELAEAIRNVMKGKRQIAPELIFGALEKTNPLTDREKEIIRLVADGKSIKEISSTLFLSSGTIRNYLSEIFAKLQAKNRIDAVRIAEEKGWM
ncbi:response regulator transcription factor [Metabacillus sp. RGM 3146]|uniref:response regulator transcription factor n=1 Tax=Metabacillus sp. RGM 3146 TaxID=3401092 RepID=UPI003B9BAC6A